MFLLARLEMDQGAGAVCQELAIMAAAGMSYRDEVRTLACDAGLAGDPMMLLVEKLAEGVERIEAIDQDAIARAAADGAYRALPKVALARDKQQMWWNVLVLISALWLAFWAGYLFGKG